MHVDKMTDQNGASERDSLLNGKTPAEKSVGLEMSVKVRKPSRVVTVEPVIVLFFTAFMANTPLTQQYIYSQIAQRYNVSNEGIPNQDECSLNISQHEKQILHKIQSETSKWVEVNTVALIFPLLFSTWLLGTYSDKAGRKIGIVLPLCGAVASMFGCVIVTAFKLPFWYIFVINFVSGLSGGPTTLLTASYSYIADVTLSAERSKRMVIISLCEGIGTVAVQVGLGYVIKYVGFACSFAILGGFYVICIIYAIFWLEETIIKQTRTVVLSMEHFLKPIRLYCRDNGTNRLWQIRLVTIVIALQNFTMVGTSTVITLFLYARPLCFGPVGLGFFNGFQCLSGIISTLLVTWYCLAKMGDAGLMILGCVSQTAYLIIMAFADQAFIVYMALGIGSANGLLTPLGRSFLSKLMNSHEQGSLFAALSWLMLVFVLIGSIAFLSIYDATLTSMPGFTFFVGAAVTMIIVGLCIIVFKYKTSSTLVSVEEDEGQLEQNR